jgi:hypothetical protein
VSTHNGEPGRPNYNSDKINDYVLDFDNLPSSNLFIDMVKGGSLKEDSYITFNQPIIIEHHKISELMKEIFGFPGDVIIESSDINIRRDESGLCISGNLNVNGNLYTIYADDNAAYIKTNNYNNEVVQYSITHKSLTMLFAHIYQTSHNDGVRQDIPVVLNSNLDYLETMDRTIQSLAILYGSMSKSYNQVLRDLDNDRILVIELIQAYSQGREQTRVHIDMAWQLTETTHELCLTSVDSTEAGETIHQSNGYRQPVNINPSLYPDRDLHAPIASQDTSPTYLDPKTDYGSWQSAVVSVMDIINRKLYPEGKHIDSTPESIEGLAEKEERLIAPEERND